MAKVGTPELVDPSKFYEFNDNEFVRCWGLNVLATDLAKDMKIR